MQKIQFKFVYNRKNKLNKDGTALIQIEAYLNRKRKYFSTGIKIKPAEWDKKKNIINKKHPKYIDYNFILQAQLKKLQERELEFLKNGKDITLQDLSVNENFDFFLQFEKYKKNHDVSQRRKDQIDLTIRTLKEFDKQISFENFNYNKIIQFDNYLETQKKLSQNSKANYHKMVQSFLNYCVKSDIIDKNPYIKFKIKTEKTKREFLTIDEIETINNIDYKLLPEQIAELKDMFIFSCYTGLRFSDIQQLTPQMFDFTDDGVFLNLQQQKTKQVQRLPLHLLFNGKPIEILNKYLDRDKKYIFSRITNQNANRLLKVIQPIAKISKNLTFHLSRHTFGTQMARLSNDPYLIKELMGHSDIATSMIYIHLNNEAMSDKLKKIEW